MSHIGDRRSQELLFYGLNIKKISQLELVESKIHFSKGFPASRGNRRQKRGHAVSLEKTIVHLLKKNPTQLFISQPFQDKQRGPGEDTPPAERSHKSTKRTSALILSEKKNTHHFYAHLNYSLKINRGNIGGLENEGLERGDRQSESLSE